MREGHDFADRVRVHQRLDAARVTVIFFGGVENVFRKMFGVGASREYNIQIRFREQLADGLGGVWPPFMDSAAAEGPEDEAWVLRARASARTV